MESTALALIIGIAGVVLAITVLAGTWLEGRERRRASYYQRALTSEYVSATDPKVESAKPISASKLGRNSEIHRGAKAGQSRKGKEVPAT